MAQVTAASFPVTFGKVTYHMSPLDDKDGDEINNWLRASYIKMARDTIDLMPELKKSEREEMLGVAMDRARNISFTEGRGQDLATSLEGFTRVFWQTLRKCHPDLTLEEFKSRIFKLKDENEDALSADMEANLAAFKELNIVPKSMETKATPPPTQPSADVA